jgi:hypothetical protein
LKKAVNRWETNGGCRRPVTRQKSLFYRHFLQV